MAFKLLLSSLVKRTPHNIPYSAHLYTISKKFVQKITFELNQNLESWSYIVLILWGAHSHRYTRYSNNTYPYPDTNALKHVLSHAWTLSLPLPHAYLSQSGRAYNVGIFVHYCCSAVITAAGTYFPIPLDRYRKDHDFRPVSSLYKWPDYSNERYISDSRRMVLFLTPKPRFRLINR